MNALAQGFSFWMLVCAFLSGNDQEVFVHQSLPIIFKMPHPALNVPNQLPDIFERPA